MVLTVLTITLTTMGERSSVERVAAAAPDSASAVAAQRTPDVAWVDVPVPTPEADSEPGSRRSDAGQPGQRERDAAAGADSRVARASERDERASNGLVELRQWLADRVSDGLGRSTAWGRTWRAVQAVGWSARGTAGPRPSRRIPG